jgi:alcohol dehydrogenase (cytochrome c)
MQQAIVAAALILGAVIIAAQQSPSVLSSYKPVTAERLKDPEPGDWLMIRRTYDGWGYSPLDRITPANVARLRPVWVFATGVGEGHEAPPLVNDGVMFVSTPRNQVLALDVKSGNLLWRYRRPLPDNAVLLQQTSRGVALYADKVFFAAAEGTLVALDATSGEPRWTAAVADNRQGLYLTMAPLVANGIVMVGASGGEFGIRGFIAGYDASSGAERWKVHTVPAPGEPGSETWPAGDAWKTGGGSVWVTGNFDPATNLAYWGTGNGAPWMGDRRPGDNLYTSSTIAVDVRTGRIRGHFQYQQNDSWDWDEVSPPILVDYERGGRRVNGLINVARDGYVWFLDRSDGSIRFVHAEPYVVQNVFKRIDPSTGRPEIDDAHKPATGKTADFCPSTWGGKSWPPAAFSPKTRMIYIPANNNLCQTSTGESVDYQAGRLFVGTKFSVYTSPNADHIGEVQAWNVDTQRRAWTHTYANSPNWGSMLATGGGLVFSGGTTDRMFHAFDAATGRLLWEFPTSSGIIGPASSFMVDGTQYIAVQSGWGTDASFMLRMLNMSTPGRFPQVPDGCAIWVFALR